MYQVLLEIDNAKQLLKTRFEAVSGILQKINGLAASQEATLKELSTGRYLLFYALNRPSDTQFIVESVYTIYDFLLSKRKELFGFSLILESVTSDEDGERYLRQLFMTITRGEGLWLGPNAALSLAAYFNLEKAGNLWRVESRTSYLETGTNLRELYFTRFSDYQTIKQKIVDRLKETQGGVASLAFLSEHNDDLGDIVNHAVEEFLGPDEKNAYFWILAQHESDPAPIGLLRTLYPMPEARIAENLEASELEEWKEVRGFLFQNAYSPLAGLAPAALSLEFPLELFNRAFLLFLLGWRRYCSKRSRPFIVHVEAWSLFNKQTMRVLHEALSRSLEDLPGQILVVYSAYQTEDVPDRVRLQDYHHFPGFFESNPRFNVAFGNSFEAMNSSRFSRHYAALAEFLLNKPLYSQKQEQESLIQKDLDRKKSFEQALFSLLLRNTDRIYQEVYYALLITYGFLPLPVFFDFLHELKIERIRHPVLIQQLLGLRLIRHEEVLVPNFQIYSETVEELLGERALEIKNSLEDFLFRRLREGSILLRLDTFLLMAEIADTVKFCHLSFNFCQDLLNARNFDTANYVLDYASNRLHNLGPGPEKSRLIVTLSFLNCRSLLLQERKQELSSAVSHLSQLHDETPKDLLAYVNLQRARHFFFERETEQSMNLVKMAMMQFQETEDYKGLSSAQVLFGHNLLGKERLLEAKEYFILARNNAGNRNAVYEDLQAGFSDIVASFILGFYSRVLGALQEPQGLYRHAVRHGLFNHVCYFEFIKGRCLFELGKYGEATIVFTDLQALAKKYPLPKAFDLSQRWKARSLLFQGDYDEGLAILPQDEENETRLFRAEACLFREDWAGALEELGPDFAPEKDNRCYLLESPDWSQGFAFLEDRVLHPFGKTGVLSSLALVYSAYAKARLGDPETAGQTLSLFTRNHRRSLADPYNFFYHFLYSLVLAELEKGNMDDEVTILGKAVKYFQERASRIEDPNQKQSFLRNNRWNREVLKRARVNNLA